jgi:hypothetical protein
MKTGWLKSGMDNMEQVFVVAAFAEEGEFNIARSLLQEVHSKPECGDGYRYDDKTGICMAA